MQHHAHELIDGFEDRPEVDLITDYAFPLPVTVLCELLGIPSADQHAFSRWTSDILSSQPGSADARPAAMRHLHGYVTELIRAKRSRPGDDLTSALVTGHDKDGDLSETELISMLFLLLVTGHETTVNLIGNGVLAFLRHPEQRELLRARPELLARAIEEILRYDSPVTMSTWRFTTEPMEIAGTEVPAGEPILVALAGANRDPGRFTDPDRFDITADRAAHLSFGHGVHHCVGAGLARIEGGIAISTLLRRLPDLALAIPEEHLQWRSGLTLRGLTTLPVVPSPTTNAPSTTPIHTSQ
jgi:cytochrome P450